MLYKECCRHQQTELEVVYIENKPTSSPGTASMTSPMHSSFVNIKEQIADAPKARLTLDSPTRESAEKTAKSQSQKGSKITDIPILQSEKYEIKNISEDQAKKHPQLFIKVYDKPDHRRPLLNEY